MTLTIEFTPCEEACLTAQAAQQGVPPAEIVKMLVDEQILERRLHFRHPRWQLHSVSV